MSLADRGASLQLPLPARVEAFARKHEAGLLVLLLGAGFFGRLAWLFLNSEERLRAHRSEMWHVAAHWAKTGVMADAYGFGSGISSHVGPVNVVIAGTLYRIFGIDTPAAEFSLSLIAAAVAIGLFWFLYKAAGELGIAVAPRLAALAILAVLPLHFYLEVIDFRIREGALAAMLAAAMLWWLLVMDRRGRPSWRVIAGFALLAGFAFLINPGVALGGYAGLGFVILRHIPWPAWPMTAAILLAGFLAVNGAWIVRNFEVYDKFMPSRGNFGLELSTANHAAAVHSADPRSTFQARMREVHPFFSPEAAARYQRYPRDIDYFDALGAETKAWIAGNPRDFAKLTGRHLKELFFPPDWLYNLYSQDQTRTSDRVKQAWAWSFAALGLLGLAVGLVSAPRRYLFVLLSLLPTVMLYSIVQPTLRYAYVLLALITYLALAFLWQLLVRAWPGKSGEMANGADWKTR